MAETHYAVMSGGSPNTIVSIAVTDNPNPTLAAAQGWIGPITPSATVGIGSTTTNNGTTWTAPTVYVVPTYLANLATIENNLVQQLNTLETFIANNPTGAILTAGQTLILAQMLAGLTRFALGATQVVGGS